MNASADAILSKLCPTHDGGKGRKLPLSDFCKDGHAHDGIRYLCRKCESARNVRAQRVVELNKNRKLQLELAPHSELSKWCPTHDGGKGQELPLSDFGKSSKAVDGVRYQCKRCQNANNRGHYLRHGNETPGSGFCHARRNAKNRGFQFELSFEEFCSIISQGCAYGSATSGQFHIGLDRKDTRGPYSLENCVGACGRHNYIKSDVFGFEAMLRVVREFPEARECADVFRRRPRKFKRLPKSVPPLDYESNGGRSLSLV